MLNLYTSPSCTSCRKAKAWLKEHDISFKERNIFANPLNKEEIMQVLRMTENGTEEIISTRSRTFQNLKINLDDLSIDQLIDLVELKPEDTWVIANEYGNGMTEKQFQKIKKNAKCLIRQDALGNLRQYFD